MFSKYLVKTLKKRLLPLEKRRGVLCREIDAINNMLCLSQE